MFDELYSYERRNALTQVLQRPAAPAPEPTTFQGFGSALADMLPHSTLQSASVWSAVMDAYGKAAAYGEGQTAASINGGPAPDMADLQAGIDQMGNSDAARDFRERAKRYAPDPAAVGMAGQIAHAVLGGLAKAGTYAVAAGPAAPALFGADIGIGRSQELSDQGVSAGTAAAAGAVSGLAGGIGFMIPASMGATRLASVGIGAAVNPALGVVERGTIHALLQHADYEKIAAQYKPFDPTQIAIEAATGALFGAAFHSAKAGKPEARTLTPEEHAAVLTMNEVRTRDADGLTRPGDIAAANQAHEAQSMARAQLDAGEPVSVAHTIEIERAQLDSAYQRVLDSPAGEALDPMVMIRPDDIDAVAISRGGWKGLGDVEVTGSGYGLVKFIWRHGERSTKNADVQIGREDVLAFPNIAREFDPQVKTDANGNEYREWRVLLPDQEGNLRQVVFVDKTMGDQGRHMVSLYVQEAARKGKEAPLSQRKTDWTPDSLGKWSDTHAKDTEPNFLHLAGQEQSAKSSIAQRAEGETPEAQSAEQRLKETPEMLIRLEDGTEAKAVDALREADEAIKQAKTEAAAFKAAIACALRFE